MVRPQRGDSERRRSLEFGELVHVLRRERRESQRVVAARIPMSVANLSRIERGIRLPLTELSAAYQPTVLAALRQAAALQ